MDVVDRVAKRLYKAYVLPFVYLCVKSGDDDLKEIGDDYWKYLASRPDEVKLLTDHFQSIGEDWSVEKAVVIFKKAAIRAAQTKKTVTRFVVVERAETEGQYVGKFKIATPCHSSHTYETEAEAQAQIPELMESGFPFNLPLTVRPCECDGELRPNSRWVG